ncbi:hypothetical protein [Caballeronia sp. dw_19]|uniref:hypothetical protein n=1 Tax=Caballeronia sp. dw_19 TaxID=2719791 RepID=UPI001BCBD3F0|nr:hypothetical protein [Caballeronia sp. dw_19]
MSTLSAPPVRSVWDEQGGTYAGVAAPWDGASQYGLVVTLVPEAKIKPAKFGPTEAMSSVSSRWDGVSNMQALLKADPDNEIANRIRDLRVGGFTDWHWPSRLESALLYASLGDQIHEFLGTWGAWICEQHPDGPSCAYVQGFGDGGQDWNRKDYEFGAVAVRRVF